ncbi:MAG TPA: GNVR domain-containing protein [Candidatus Hydrogenedentes bacterium]|nr:GNVR domain-containing protein [Candidatus Hydrogenedentota bacterium]HPG67285.1 GNVR domain-containing protein [Candidatus Hydrogenedentota bacterium]
MQTSVRDLLYVIFRHKWKIIFVFVVVAVAVGVYTYMVQEMYRSDAKLFVRLGRNLSLDPTVTGPTLPVYTDRESDVKSEVAILTSRSVIEEVLDYTGEEMFLRHADELAGKGASQEKLRILRRAMRQAEEAVMGLLIRLDLAPDLTPREKAIKRIQDNLWVEMERKANIINVSFDAQGADLSQQTLDALVQTYMKHHIKAHASQATPEFFEQQAEGLRADLNEKEQELNTFREEHGIIELTEQIENLFTQISGIETEIEDVASTASGYQASVKSLEKALQGRPETRELNRISGRTNYAADKLKERLIELRAEETDLAARYPEGHRPLIQVREEIKSAEEALAAEGETREEVTTGLDSYYQELELKLNEQRAIYELNSGRLNVLEENLAKKKAELTKLSARQLELDRLMRDTELAETDFREYRDNLLRSRVSAALDMDNISNVSIVQSASLPLEPVKPNKPLNLALGILLGLFGGVFLAFALEYFDETLNTKEKAERCLGVPVLAAVSEEEFKGCI